MTTQYPNLGMLGIEMHQNLEFFLGILDKLVVVGLNHFTMLEFNNAKNLRKYKKCKN